MMLHVAYLCITIVYLSKAVLSQSPCTLPSTFQNSVWVDSDKGDIEFGTVNMTGWDFEDPSLLNDIVQDWECYYTGTVGSKLYLIMRCQHNITLEDTFTPYLCMELTEVSSHLYYYYLLWAQQGNYKNERITTRDVTFSVSNAVQDLCLDITNPVHAANYPEVSEYHVLVKKGNEADAKRECPSTFFGKYNYKVSDAFTSTDYCGYGNETWDVCTDYSRMTFNYDICDTEVSYSANGSVFCLVSITSGSYVYHTVYNEDNTVDVSSGTYRFTCFMSVIGSDGSLNVSQTPGSCKKGQTPTTQPVFPNNMSVAGLNMELTPIVLCPKTSGKSGGLSTGAIVGIVFGILIFIAAIILVLLICMKGKCRQPKEEKNTEDKSPVASPRSKKLSVDIDDLPHQRAPHWIHGPHGTAPVETKFSGDHKISKSPTLDHKYNPFSVPPLAKRAISQSQEVSNGVYQSGETSRRKNENRESPNSEQTFERLLNNSPIKKDIVTRSKSIQTENLVIEDLDKSEYSENTHSLRRNMHSKPEEKTEPSELILEKDALPVHTATGRFQFPQHGNEDVVSRNSNVTPKSILLETKDSKGNTPDIHGKGPSSVIPKEHEEHQRKTLSEPRNRNDIEGEDAEVSMVFRGFDKQSTQSPVIVNQTGQKPLTPTSITSKQVEEIPNLEKGSSRKVMQSTVNFLPNNPEIINNYFKEEEAKYAASFIHKSKSPLHVTGKERNGNVKKKNNIIEKSKTDVLVKDKPKKPKKSTKSVSANKKSNKRGQQAFTSLLRSKSMGVKRNKKGTFYNEDIPTVPEMESYLNISETRDSEKGICYDEDNEKARALCYWNNDDTLETNVSNYGNQDDDARNGKSREFKSALGTSEERSVSRLTLSTDISVQGSLSTRSISAITSRIDSRGAKYFIENESSSIAIHVKASDVPDNLGSEERGTENAELNQDEDDEYEDEDEDGDEDFDENKEAKDDIQTSMSVLYGPITEEEDEGEDPDRMVLTGYEPNLLTIKE